MTDSFGYDPKLHDALWWLVVRNGIRWRRWFKSESTAWGAILADVGYGMTTAAVIEQRQEQGYSVVPCAWSHKPQA